MIGNALRHLKIADMELLVTAASLKNLTKAAALHNLSQSAASAAIKRVEIAFGRALCRHERRQFRLTNDGNSLIPKIEQWLRQFKEDVATEIHRPIRLATTHAIARVIIPSLLRVDAIDLLLMRPDRGYRAVLEDEADLTIVPDNFPWEGLHSVEIGVGSFGLFSSAKDVPLSPVLLPENQIEVLKLIQRWNQTHKKTIAIKSRIPSWSLIADLCAGSKEVGFLPDFLAKKMGLFPVAWQPRMSSYRLLLLHASLEEQMELRLNNIINCCIKVFC